MLLSRDEQYGHLTLTVSRWANAILWRYIGDGGRTTPGHLKGDKWEVLGFLSTNGTITNNKYILQNKILLSKQPEDAPDPESEKPQLKQVNYVFFPSFFSLFDWYHSKIMQQFSIQLSVSAAWDLRPIPHLKLASITHSSFQHGGFFWGHTVFITNQSWLNSRLRLSFSHLFLRLPATKLKRNKKGIIPDKVCIKGTTKTQPPCALCWMPPHRPRCGQELYILYIYCTGDNCSLSDSRNIQSNQDVVSGNMLPLLKCQQRCQTLVDNNKPAAFPFDLIVPLRQ